MFKSCAWGPGIWWGSVWIYRYPRLLQISSASYGSPDRSAQGKVSCSGISRTRMGSRQMRCQVQWIRRPWILRRPGMTLHTGYGDRPGAAAIEALQATMRSSACQSTDCNPQRTYCTQAATGYKIPYTRLRPAASPAAADIPRYFQSEPLTSSSSSATRLDPRWFSYSSSETCISRPESTTYQPSSKSCLSVYEIYDLDLLILTRAI